MINDKLRWPCTLENDIKQQKWAHCPIGFHWYKCGTLAQNSSNLQSTCEQATKWDYVAHPTSKIKPRLTKKELKQKPNIQWNIKKYPQQNPSPKHTSFCCHDLGAPDPAGRLTISPRYQEVTLAVKSCQALMGFSQWFCWCAWFDGVNVYDLECLGVFWRIGGWDWMLLQCGRHIAKIDMLLFSLAGQAVL